MKELIRQRARELGFDACAFAPAGQCTWQVVFTSVHMISSSDPRSAHCTYSFVQRFSQPSGMLGSARAEALSSAPE